MARGETENDDEDRGEAEVTKSSVVKAVKRIVEELTEEHDNHNDWMDGAFEKVDEWWTAVIGTGRIEDLGEYPVDETDLGYLQDAITIMQAADEEDWGVADDKGLWEGLDPWQAVLSQAFFTMEQAVAQQEPKDLE